MVGRSLLAAAGRAEVVEGKIPVENAGVDRFGLESGTSLVPVVER